MAIAIPNRQFCTTWIDGTRRRREFVIAALAVVVSLLMAGLVIVANVAALAALFIPVAAIAIALRPRYGLYLIFAILLFFDGTTEDPLMLPGYYINFSLQTTLNLTGGILIPIEMLVLFTAAVWLAQGAMRRRLDFRSGSLGRPVLLFACVLVFAVVRGLVSGANFNYAFWESRFLFGMVLTYTITSNTIRTRGHIRTLTTLVVIFAGLSCVEAIWRRYALINTGLLGELQEKWYSHEDVIIWGMVLLLVFAQAVFGGPRWQRLIAPFLALASVLAMLVSERRAGLISVMIALALFTLSLYKINRKAFWLIAIPALFAGLVYFPLFWNNDGTLGQAARAVRSISSSADARDAASNAWRDLEAINVRATIASDPLMGIGFGRPFLQVVTVPDISFFEFWDYEAHHNVLWVWMKTGAFGFICFFTVLLGGIARSVWLAKTLRDPSLRVFAVLGMSGVVMSMVFAYVDIALSGQRVPLLLGVMLGAVSVLHRIEQDEPPATQTASTSARHAG